MAPARRSRHPGSGARWPGQRRYARDGDDVPVLPRGALPDSRWRPLDSRSHEPDGLGCASPGVGTLAGASAAG
eukprot:5212870-Prymnesium_polylepis.1